MYPAMDANDFGFQSDSRLSHTIPGHCALRFDLCFFLTAVKMNFAGRVSEAEILKSPQLESTPRRSKRTSTYAPSTQVSKEIVRNAQQLPTPLRSIAKKRPKLCASTKKVPADPSRIPFLQVAVTDEVNRPVLATLAHDINSTAKELFDIGRSDNSGSLHPTSILDQVS
jgi:hypothetical protein